MSENILMGFSPRTYLLLAKYVFTFCTRARKKIINNKWITFQLTKKYLYIGTGKCYYFSNQLATFLKNYKTHIYFLSVYILWDSKFIVLRSLHIVLAHVSKGFQIILFIWLIHYIHIWSFTGYISFFHTHIYSFKREIWWIYYIVSCLVNFGTADREQSFYTSTCI